VQVQQPPPQQTAIAVSSSAKPATTDLNRAPPAPAAPAKASGPAHTNAVVNFDTCAKPEYPKSSLRNEETGTSTISFLISADGSVKDSKITRSSGFRDLDKAAVAALSKCRFKPATENGQAVETWSPVAYVWNLD
jgi:protein TonB